MLLNRSVLNLAKLAAKEPYRRVLPAILIEKDRAVVCDKHVLVYVDNSSPMADENFPIVPGLEHRTFSDGSTTESVLVSREAALGALKVLPKKSTIPVLTNAAMGKDGKLYTNDLENIVSFDHEIEGKFPNWRNVIPTGDPIAEIGFDARKMIELCKYFVENGNKGTRPVRLTIYAKDLPMRLDSYTTDSQDVTALLAPVRLDGNSKFAMRPGQVRAVEAKAEEWEHPSSSNERSANMPDIVKCSHCDLSVLWPDYGSHIEIWHSRWGSISKPLGLPETRTLGGIQSHIDELEAQAEKEALE